MVSRSPKRCHAIWERYNITHNEVEYIILENGLQKLNLGFKNLSEESLDVKD